MAARDTTATAGCAEHYAHRPAYRSRMVLMTPTLASELLQKNVGNRPLNKRRVDKYAGLMSRGEWDAENPDGCSTAIDSNHVLLNSQHRLYSIVQSGVSIWWRLDENVHPRARATYDIGRTRTPGDFLVSEMGDRVLDANKMAAAARVFHAVDASLGGIDDVGREELLSVVEVYFDDLRFGLRKASPSNSVVAGAFAWVHATLPSRRESLSTLAEQVLTGINASATAALLSELTGARRKSTNVRGLRTGAQADRWIVALLTLRLIESWLVGKELTRMPFLRSAGEDLVIARLRHISRSESSK